MVKSLVIALMGVLLGSSQASQTAPGMAFVPELVKDPYLTASTAPLFDPVRWNYPVLPRMLYPDDNGQCVNYAKALTKKDGNIFKGDAIEWAKYVNSRIPSLGSIAVFKIKEGVGHLAVVVEVGMDYFIVSERNFGDQLFKVRERIILMNDPTLIGFVK